MCAQILLVQLVCFTLHSKYLQLWSAVSLPYSAVNEGATYADCVRYASYLDFSSHRVHPPKLDGAYVAYGTPCLLCRFYNEGVLFQCYVSSVCQHHVQGW